jgi:hypothetical protein
MVDTVFLAQATSLVFGTILAAPLLSVWLCTTLAFCAPITLSILTFMVSAKADSGISNASAMNNRFIKLSI